MVVGRGGPAEMARESGETAGEGTVSGDGSVEGSISTAGNMTAEMGDPVPIVSLELGKQLT